MITFKPHNYPQTHADYCLKKQLDTNENNRLRLSAWSAANIFLLLHMNQAIITNNNVTGVYLIVCLPI